MEKIERLEESQLWGKVGISSLFFYLGHLLFLVIFLGLFYFAHLWRNSPPKYLTAFGFFMLGMFILRFVWLQISSVRLILFLPTVVFIMAYFLYFPLDGVDAIINDRQFGFIPNQDLMLFKVMLLAWIGFLSFKMGCRKQFVLKQLWQDRENNSVSIPKFYIHPWIIAALFFVGVFSEAREFSLGEGTVAILRSSFKFAIFLILFLWLLKRKPLYFFLFVFMATIFFYFQARDVMYNRAEILIPFVGMLALWDFSRLLRTKKSKNNMGYLLLRAFLIVIVAFILFLFLSQLRFLGEVQTLTPSETYEFSKTFFDGLERTTKIVQDVPSKVDYLYGKSFLYSFYTIIPSALWPNKPVNALSADEWVVILLYPSLDPARSKFPPPIIGELYFNFGVLFVAMGMFVIGLVLRFFDKILISSRNPLVILYLASLISLLVHFVRGPMGNFFFRATGDLIMFMFICLTMILIPMKGSNRFSFVSKS
jgi:hypothetical protein